MTGPFLRDVTVYRVNYVRNFKIPIGTISERREKDRPENLLGLLMVARKRYSSTPQEAFQTVIDATLLTRR